MDVKVAFLNENLPGAVRFRLGPKVMSLYTNALQKSVFLINHLQSLIETSLGTLRTTFGAKDPALYFKATLLGMSRDHSVRAFPSCFPKSLKLVNGYPWGEPVSRSGWNWIVEQYSGAQRTYDRDKLVPLSGLAQQIQLQNQEEYFAGIWRGRLEHELC
jgi:hypothetical protein